MAQVELSPRELSLFSRRWSIGLTTTTMMIPMTK
jgi:hypothetical protein